MSFRPLVLAATLALAPAAASRAVLRAQTAVEYVAAGDRERAMNPAAALTQYEAALKADPNDYDALTKAAYAAVEAGQAAGDNKAQQRALYRQGEEYARKAVQLKPNDAEGHFVLAAALGRTAQTLGPRDRVRYAAEVRDQALEALKYNPRHAGALHVMGMWNAEIMRLSGISRFMAKTFLGGKVFGTANWDDAQRYLEEAVQVEPERLTHRVDLAGVYLDRGEKAKAREQLEYIASAPIREANDATYKRQAQSMLSRAS